MIFQWFFFGGWGKLLFTGKEVGNVSNFVKPNQELINKYFC